MKNERIVIRRVDDGFITTIHDLDFSFLNNMREAKTEELEGINDYVNSISLDTGINFFDILKEND